MFAPALSLALALFAQGGPATAPGAASGNPSATASSAAAAPQADADPVVCHTVTDTGTRFGHRVCHTTSEWQAISAEAQSQVQQDQRMSGQTGGPH